jgi:2Fe-2S ferredoxin
MPKVTFIASDGTTTEVDAKVGDSLMQAAVNNMVDGVVAECGGCLSCATCHVYVDDAWTAKVGPAGSDEKDMLQLAVDPNDSSRLSCQVSITDDLDGLVVRIPEAQF